jgi:L-alanine-DL-glutamate epimerase-like enolase superfamily enzyme
VEYLPWAEPIFGGRPAIEDGMLVLADRPGLGLELDERAIRRYAAA